MWLSLQKLEMADFMDAVSFTVMYYDRPIQ